MDVHANLKERGTLGTCDQRNGCPKSEPRRQVNTFIHVISQKKSSHTHDNTAVSLFITIQSMDTERIMTSMARQPLFLRIGVNLPNLILKFHSKCTEQQWKNQNVPTDGVPRSTRKSGVDLPKKDIGPLRQEKNFPFIPKS